ncbi:hypothetical protein [Microbaculum marinisediminis]|uniref:hypothetical protein n=1 Tax=Microbaculum marinisediminis TaxID=2931392 RepID=UPI0021BE10CE|nr:hypothetical protein [Microbaculum sp. A6E488]
MTLKNRMAGMIAGLALAASAGAAVAEIDGYGPDNWRVVGVARDDVLNARMGPDSRYPVIESFRHDEGGLEQITCVPFIPPAHFLRMSEAELDALPPRWCLMRDRTLARAGWVNAGYLEPDYGPADAESVASIPGDDPVAAAEELVRALYEMRSNEYRGMTTGLYTPAGARRFFHADLVDRFLSGAAGADPVYGAQDFEGHCEAPRRHPDQPMLRGMITVIVDCTNFGQRQRAEYNLRVDPVAPDSTPRIFRISHDGWEFP